MSQTSTESIFQSSSVSNPPAGKAWRSYIGSGIVHSVIILLVLSITIPAVRPVRKAVQHATLLAPILPHPAYQMKVPPPPRVVAPVVVTPTPLFRPVPVKVLNVPPPPKPVIPKPVTITAAPELRVETTRPTVEIKPELPAAPKIAIQTGAFQKTTELAKSTPEPKVLAVGGFGDPNGVTPSQNSKPGITLAKVGAFDAPNGSGTSGGGGHALAGGVKASSFGSGGVANANASDGARSTGQVHSSGFNDSAAPASPKRTTEATAAAAPAVTPVEILFKPRPLYTTEARNLRLEGHVSLEVVFLSTGSIKVVRVVHGLGHGLDEAAQQAALQVKFKPAMRGGVAVDTNATINITFELT